MTRVVTLGETLALMSASRTGPLKHNPSLSLGIGGSESNVAIGLSRLGIPVTWIGKVGCDPLGDLILGQIAAEGVEVVGIREPGAPTALMIKEQRTAVDARIWYYRDGYAGSKLGVSEVDFELIRSASLLHVTGISLALGPSTEEVVHEAIRVAREAGVSVSFDFNYRSRLWSRATAAEAYRRILGSVDVVFAGDEEAELLLGERDSIELAAELAAFGPAEAVIKLGPRGAVASVGGVTYHQQAVPIVPVDTVGAGDAFVAAYLAERLLDEPVTNRLLTAVAAGAYACLTRGDWEGFPTREELGRLAATEPVQR